MEPLHLAPEVLEQLHIEHGASGRRAGEFLETAFALLAAPQAGAPRVGQGVAYFVREALASITATGKGAVAGRWRTLSRRVVYAKTRYERALGLPETAAEADAALADVLRAVDDLEEFHGSEGLRQEHLVASIVDRTGWQLHPVGARLVEDFLQVLKGANDAAHAAAEFEEPLTLYNRATAVLTSLFQPPGLRFEALETLARVPKPMEDDVEHLRRLVVSPLHLRRFLSAVRSTRWLDVLLDTGMLDPPLEFAAWPGSAATVTLAQTDPAGLVEWLERLYRRCDRNAVQAWHVMRAAQDLGDDADGLLLRVLAEHVQEDAVRELAFTTLLKRPDRDALVKDVADHLLNDRAEDAWVLQEVAKALVRGMDADNGLDRLRLLTLKLRAVPVKEARWQWLSLDRHGSIRDRSLDGARTRFDVLVAALVAAATAVRASVGTDAVLKEVDSLPGELRSRFRAWLFGTDPTTSPALMAAELATSIASRGPSVDDLTMLDYVVGAMSSDDFLPGWIDALGPAPTVERLTEAIAGGRLDSAWERAYEWLGVLPNDARTAWADAFAVMCQAHGTPSREALRARRPGEVLSGRSPIEAGELAAVPPLEAATKVGRWRRDPAEFHVGPRELARTLQAVVAADPAGWLADPIAIAVALREPIHIDHYLLGAADAVKAGAHVDPAALMDLVDLAVSSPWPATALGRSDWDYEPDWSTCRDSAIGLLRAMADGSVGFAGRDSHAWAIIKAATMAPASLRVSGEDGPLTAAINQPPTRALESAVSLLAYQVRTSGEPDSDVLRHLEHLLAVDGARGALNRAIVGSRLAFFVSALPEWVESVDEVLFGSAAPDGLGQLTVDVSLKWSGPSRWLLERHRPQVLDAASRKVDNALEHVLLGYLWQCRGYSGDYLAKFLMSQGLTSEAGEAMGRMLRDAPADAARLGVALWRSVLETSSSRSLAGFGWFAEVRAVDDADWCDLTLRTMRASDGPVAWTRGIAKRVVSMDPTTTTLAIVDELVRRPERQWEVLTTGEAAVQHLQRAGDLRETVEYQRLHAALAERGLG